MPARRASSSRSLPIEGDGRLQRLVKGQMDGIGTPSAPACQRRRRRSAGRPRLFDPEQVPDVPAAIAGRRRLAARRASASTPLAVGHRVVHGGPDYDRPVLIDDEVLAQLERYVPLAPLHQPHNLAPIRAILRSAFRTLPQVACFDTAFHRGHSALADHYAIPRALLRRRRAALRLPRPVLRIHRRAPAARSRRRSPTAA